MSENVKKWAEKLDGREIGNELTGDEIKELEALGLVVVFGASDDLCEFRGAIDDEAGCFDGGDIYVSEKGMIAKNMDMFNEFVPENSPEFALIKACWGRDGYSWSYETDIPHEFFEIFDDGEPYCLGIIFDIANLRRNDSGKHEEIIPDSELPF